MSLTLHTIGGGARPRARVMDADKPDRGRRHRLDISLIRSRCISKPRRDEHFFSGITMENFFMNFNGARQFSSFKIALSKSYACVGVFSVR